MPFGDATPTFHYEAGDLLMHFRQAERRRERRETPKGQEGEVGSRSSKLMNTRGLCILSRVSSKLNWKSPTQLRVKVSLCAELGADWCRKDAPFAREMLCQSDARGTAFSLFFYFYTHSSTWDRFFSSSWLITRTSLLNTLITYTLKCRVNWASIQVQLGQEPARHPKSLNWLNGVSCQ